MRLELSSEGRYTLRALVYLAQTGEQVTADRIFAETRIPRRLLSRILADLVQAGLVKSLQGRKGGSFLARPPQEITLREAVEAAEGPFEVTRCIMQERACGEGKPCAIHNAWVTGQEAILNYLETRTIADFTSQDLPEKQTLDS